VGLWDTVSSVIVPRKDRLYIPSLRQLAYTASNPSVESVRHALAIDERRRMFRPYLWKESQPYWGGPFEPNEPVEQDLKQLWFAGVHSDVGGGYPEAESGLSKLALKWMIDESPEELKFVPQSVNQVVLGKKRKDSKYSYSPPDPKAKMHESLKGAWNVLEWLPKKENRREWSQRKSKLGWYLPRAEPRLIESGSLVHPSVMDRKESDIGYDPVNLPGQEE
jgi:uncharacterized protein (DUF2235 family)